MDSKQSCKFNETHLKEPRKNETSQKCDCNNKKCFTLICEKKKVAVNYKATQINKQMYKTSVTCKFRRHICKSNITN
jgi:hypothetical protein